MTTASSSSDLTSVLGAKYIAPLGGDRINDYLKQRLEGVRGQLLEVTVTRSLVSVSTDTAEAQRDATLEALDKQVSSLQASVNVLEGAIKSTPASADA